MRKRALGATDQDLDQLTVLFRLLSDKTRLTILMLLAHGERNVTSLCQELSLPQPTVSHHLGLLRMNNIIGNRRSGKQVFYGLSSELERNEGVVLEMTAENFLVHVLQKLPE